MQCCPLAVVRAGADTEQEEERAPGYAEQEAGGGGHHGGCVFFAPHFPRPGTGKEAFQLMIIRYAQVYMFSL